MAERDWSVIHYNEHLTLHDIPARAWTYRVGLQPALKSVRNYQFQRHDRRTGIVGDGNLYCPTHDTRLIFSARSCGSPSLPST